MKKTLLLSIIIILTVFSKIYSQNLEQETLYTFILLEGKENGDDISEQITDDDTRMIFYKNSNTDIVSFANIRENVNKQTYGPAIEFKKTSTKADIEYYKTVTLEFKWHYKNSFDDRKGIGHVKIVKIYKTLATFCNI